MNWADYSVIAIFLISIVISLFRGFAREFLALAIWVAAFWVAATFSDDLDARLVDEISLPSARLAVSYVLLFVVTLLSGGILNYMLGKLIDSTGISGTDRMLGMIFGFGRALLLVTALILLLKLTPLTRDAWWQDSVLVPRLERLADWSTQFFPESLQSVFADDSATETDEAGGDDVDSGDTTRFNIRDFLSGDDDRARDDARSESESAPDDDNNDDSGQPDSGSDNDEDDPGT